MNRRCQYYLKTLSSHSKIFHTTVVLCAVLLKGLAFGNINTKDLTYRVYQDLQLSGCHLVNLNTAEKTRLACAIFCSTDSSCAAFKYLDVSSECMTCRRNEVTGISFMTGEFTLLPQVMRQGNWPFANGQFTNRSVEVPGGMKAGMVVRVTGLLLSDVDFYINFDEADDMRDVNFHFRARTAYGTQNLILVLNNYKSDTWGPEIRPVMSPYPFKANTNTTLHILVREDMFLLNIDNKLCCNYTHVLGMLYTKVNYIRVLGAIQVHEISS